MTDHDLQTAAPEPDPAPATVRATSSGEPKARRPAISYTGFTTTSAGREYRLRVTDGLEPRVFVLLIPHAAFAAREMQFQDAPDLCFARLQRELLADPELLPETTRLVLTAADLLDYKVAHEKPAAVRKRKLPVA